MANLGNLGPPNALIPFMPATPSSTNLGRSLTDDEQMRLMVAVGVPDVRKLRRNSDEEFDRISDDANEMTEEQFVVFASQLWCFERRKARAVFYACDCGDYRLDKNEYLLARLAFVEENLANPQHEELVNVRLRAVFHLYVLARPAQRNPDFNTSLEYHELMAWVRDMCRGETHVQKMASSILPALGCRDDDCGEKVTLERFGNALQSHLGDRLAEEGLSLDDYWRKDSGHIKFNRVVLDGRAESVVGKTHRSDIIPAECVNADISLNPKVRAVGGWRGPYAPNRPAKEYQLADGILNVAMRWARELASQERNKIGLDHHWKPDGAALKELLNYEGQATHSFISGEMGIVCDESGLVQEVSADGLAHTKGIKKGDRIVKVGTEVFSKHALVRAETSGISYEVTSQVGKRRKLSHECEQEYYQAEKIVKLARACEKQLRAQPTVVRVPPPAKVFGDVHGQLVDLLLLFGHFGLPTHLGGDIQTTQYVFNGDWVDRGEHQLEVVCVLFALKVMYPKHVFLVRGNHEFRSTNEEMADAGFVYHCKWQFTRYAEMVYDAIHQAFDWLPIAAVIGGKVLTVHGGIGDGSWGLKELESVQRPLTDFSPQCVLDAFWSDPSDSDHSMAKGVHRNYDRGDSIHQFGPDITSTFCEREGISVIIRSHQFVRQGYKVMHSGHLITLFSAANYLTEDGGEPNDSAMLLLSEDLNAHLRVHPKRILGFQPVKLSLLQRLAGCLPCRAADQR